jgi:hypothetical protein
MRKATGLAAPSRYFLELLSELIYAESNSRSNVPEQSVLLQNFPNPFNPETWIPYQLRKSCEVIICIYTQTGELLRKLDLGYKPSGFYTGKKQAAYWDGKNMWGENVESGVYFYSIYAGDFAAVRKLVILE